MPRSIRLSLPLLAVALLSACSAAPPPDPPKQPDAPSGDTQLRDVIQKPIDRAKGVESKIQDEKDRTDSQLNDAGG